MLFARNLNVKIQPYFNRSRREFAMWPFPRLIEDQLYRQHAETDQYQYFPHIHICEFCIVPVFTFIYADVSTQLFVCRDCYDIHFKLYYLLVAEVIEILRREMCDDVAMSIFARLLRRVVVPRLCIGL